MADDNRLGDRRGQFKAGADVEEIRRRREDEEVQLRKAEKADLLAQKRRFFTGEGGEAQRGREGRVAPRRARDVKQLRVEARREAEHGGHGRAGNVYEKICGSFIPNLVFAKSRMSKLFSINRSFAQFIVRGQLIFP